VARVEERAAFQSFGRAYFQFGGSDPIVLFEAVCNVKLTAQPQVHHDQGQAIGLAYPDR
jgi:phosphatidylserine decarboxylase